MTPVFDGVVLAGGASRRFGSDKALASRDGTPLVLVAVEALRAAGAAAVVVVGGDPSIASLAVQQVSDEQPGAGPLPALAQALELPGAPIVAILACDLPDVAPAELVRLVHALELATHDAVVSLLDGRPQWLHGAWRRSCAPKVRASLDAGVTSLHAAAALLDVDFLELRDVRSAIDVDHPEDLGRRPTERTD